MESHSKQVNRNVFVERKQHSGVRRLVKILL